MGKVALNRQYAAVLGWTPEQFGVLAIDDKCTVAVREFQEVHGLSNDGVAGPITCIRLVEVLFAQELQGPGDDVLVRGGRLALLEARRRWLGNVVDPPDNSARWEASRRVIDTCIRTEQGLGWTWEDPYVRNGDYEWCGAFAGNAWRAGGIRLDLRKNFFASTYRLDRYARYRQAFENVSNPRPADNPRKVIDLDENSGPIDAMFALSDPPREGDILLVGTARRAYGHHICIVESYDLTTGMFTTIEGNGTGRAPNGKKIHGIVRAQRPVGRPDGASSSDYHARRLIRPSPHDF